MELSYRKISLNLFAAKILTENIFNFVYFVLRGSNEKCAYLYTFVSDTRDYDLEPTNSHWCVTIPTNCAHTNWIQANRLRVISRKIFGVFPRIRIGIAVDPGEYTRTWRFSLLRSLTTGVPVRRNRVKTRMFLTRKNLTSPLLLRMNCYIDTIIKVIFKYSRYAKIFFIKYSCFKYSF